MLIIRYCQARLTSLLIFVDISVGFTNATYTVYENASQAELYILVSLQRDVIVNFSTSNSDTLLLGMLLQYIGAVMKIGLRIKLPCIKFNDLVGAAIERDIALQVSTYNSDAIRKL